MKNPFLRLSKASAPLDWLLQKPCPLCDRLTGSDLCSACWQQVQQCQLGDAARFSSPSPADSSAAIPVFAWGSYGGALKRAIAALKYHNQPQLGRLLGDRLGQTWISQFADSEPLAVIPIPLHSEKRQQRGFNQAELLAAAFCDRTGLLLQPEGLIRVRSTVAQFGLDAATRQQNLSDAFQVGRLRRSASKILLIDDIYTTGATARAAVQALEQQKLAVWGIAVVARTEKDRQKSDRPA